MVTFLKLNLFPFICLSIKNKSKGHSFVERNLFNIKKNAEVPTCAGMTKYFFYTQVVCTSTPTIKSKTFFL